MSDTPVSDEGVLDPWVAEWIAANPDRATPFADLVSELLELAHGDYGPQLTQEIDHVDDEQVGDIPIRIYRNDGDPGPGRVLPRRWARHGEHRRHGRCGPRDRPRLRRGGGVGELPPGPGGPLPGRRRRLRGRDPMGTGRKRAVRPAADRGGRGRRECRRHHGRGRGAPAAGRRRCPARRAGADLPCGSPARRSWLPGRSSAGSSSASRPARPSGRRTAAAATSTTIRTPPRLRPVVGRAPPALVVLGGCDMLRDEGRAYGERLRADGVEVEEVCYAGQPHGSSTSASPLPPSPSSAPAGGSGTRSNRRAVPDGDLYAWSRRSSRTPDGVPPPEVTTAVGAPATWRSPASWRSCVTAS